MRVNVSDSISYGKLNFRLTKKDADKSKTDNAQKDINDRAGIYVNPIKTTKAQEGTIQKALDELSKVKFSANDILYMQNMGVNLAFQNGKEAVDYLNSKNIEVMYAEFSNPSVHACLDTTDEIPAVLINSNYKDLASFSDILAISEAMFHEAGHAKDGDSNNSIQEEIDCLALNVLAHEHYKKAYPDIFKDRNSPLYREGVSLYDALFFDFDQNKEALKKRISEKYGFLDVSSKNHNPSKMANDIKKCHEV